MVPFDDPKAILELERPTVPVATDATVDLSDDTALLASDVLQGASLRELVHPLVIYDRALERLPAHLDGRQGSNRAPAHPAALKAVDDLDALARYLETKCSGGLTQQRHITELTRFHAWSVAMAGKPVSSLDADDLRAYARFCASPPVEWCAPRAGRTKRGEGNWRPFTGPLSEVMLIRALKHIDNYFSWLVDVKYLYITPFAHLENAPQLAKAARIWAMREKLIPVERADPRYAKRRKADRALNDAQRQAMILAVERMPKRNWEQRFQYERTRWLITLALCGAARVSDLVRGKMKYIEEVPAGSGVYAWSVIGKGNKAADIALPDEAIRAQRRFMDFMGLEYPPSESDDTALIPRTRAHSPTEALRSPTKYTESVTPQRINQVLKQLAAIAAEILLEQDPIGHAADAARLRKLSSHWWRHTGLTQMADNNAPGRVIQAHARHRSQKTTEETYLHTVLREQHEAVNKYLDFAWPV